MRTLIFSFAMLLISSLALGQGGGSWTHFGDSIRVSPRTYSDITNFFMFQGPGNENPDNVLCLDTNNQNLRLSDTRASYIAEQFKYVLFDQASYADRSDPNHHQFMTQVYHDEAKRLMASSPNIIVFPYFCFTITNPSYPWYTSITESMILHSGGH